MICKPLSFIGILRTKYFLVFSYLFVHRLSENILDPFSKCVLTIAILGFIYFWHCIFSFLPKYLKFSSLKTSAYFEKMRWTNGKIQTNIDESVIISGLMLNTSPSTFYLLKLFAFWFRCFFSFWYKNINFVDFFNLSPRFSRDNKQFVYSVDEYITLSTWPICQGQKVTRRGSKFCSEWR